MSTLGGVTLSLMDWAKNLDPDGGIAKVVELLNQSNEILLDMVWQEGNLPTGHRATVRTGLPTAAWRILNSGVTPSKATTAQIDEACGILEAWCEIDEEVCDLNGTSSAFRLSQAMAFIEAMNQQMAATLFYGDTTVNPERFLGLAPRFSTISGAINGQNVMSANGSGSDNSSIYLVGWGENSVHGIFPKGSKAGLVHEDLGLQIVQTGTGIGAGRLRAYIDQWKWKSGIALKDWRYVVRLCNIDISDLTGSTGTQNAQQLIKLMSRMLDRIPTFSNIRPVFYMNRTVYSVLRVQGLDKSQNAISVGDALDQFGNPTKGMLQFSGIPIRRCDQLLNTEATIS